MSESDYSHLSLFEDYYTSIPLDVDLYSRSPLFGRGLGYHNWLGEFFGQFRNESDPKTFVNNIYHHYERLEPLRIQRDKERREEEERNGLGEEENKRLREEEIQRRVKEHGKRIDEQERLAEEREERRAKKEKEEAERKERMERLRFDSFRGFRESLNKSLEEMGLNYDNDTYTSNERIQIALQQLKDPNIQSDANQLGMSVSELALERYEDEQDVAEGRTGRLYEKRFNRSLGLQGPAFEKLSRKAEELRSQNARRYNQDTDERVRDEGGKEEDD